MSSHRNSKIMKFMAEHYRERENEAFLWDLAGTNADLTYGFVQLCKKNNIEIPEGLGKLMGEAKRTLKKISETNTLPLPELLRRPPTIAFDDVPHHPKSATRFGHHDYWTV